MKSLLALVVLFVVVPSTADIVVENEPIIYDEIFDLDYAIESDESIYSAKQAKYYCVFRSNWNKENHPADYPKLARWSAPLLYSHTKQYFPALKNKEAPNGVEQLVEVSYISLFSDAAFADFKSVLVQICPNLSC
jgi:Spondin_N